MHIVKGWYAMGMAFPSYANAARGLGLRERKFIAGLMAGKAMARAYADAGYAVTHDIDVRAWHKLRTAKVYAYWQACLASMGLDDETLAAKARAFIETAMSPDTPTDLRLQATVTLLQLAGMALREQDIVGPKKPGRKPRNSQPD